MYFSNLYPMSLTKKKTYSDTFSLFPHQHLFGRVCAYNPLDLETPVFRQRREKKEGHEWHNFRGNETRKGFPEVFSNVQIFTSTTREGGLQSPTPHSLPRAFPRWKEEALWKWTYPTHEKTSERFLPSPPPLKNIFTKCTVNQLDKGQQKL